MIFVTYVSSIKPFKEVKFQKLKMLILSFIASFIADVKFYWMKPL